MITASESEPFLRLLCRLVDEMQPGQNVKIDKYQLLEIATFWHNDAHFTAADRVLGNIVGSAYTHSFRKDIDGGVIFSRHEDTGRRRYEAPDRRASQPEQEVVARASQPLRQP